MHVPKVDVERRTTEWYDRLTLFRAIRTVLLVAIALVLLAGLLARLVEPDVFTSIGISYWWAVTTVTTTGYGDIVPESTPGRLLGAGLMLLGISLIPTLTSVVVATLVGKRQRQQQEQMERLGREHADALRQIEERLAQLAKAQAGGSQAPG